MSIEPTGRFRALASRNIRFDLRAKRASEKGDGTPKSGGPIAPPVALRITNSPIGKNLEIIQQEFAAKLLEADKLDRPDQLEKAFTLMINFHRNEVLPGGEKTTINLINTAKIIIDWGGNATLAAAALVNQIPETLLINSGLDRSIIDLTNKKRYLDKLLFLPLDEKKLNDQEAAYLAFLGLKNISDKEAWLLTAADCYQTLSTYNVIPSGENNYASRVFHVLPKALRLLHAEVIASTLAEIAFPHVDVKEYERIKRITTENQLDQEHLQLLTDIIDLDLGETGIKYFVQRRIKDTTSLKEKLEQKKEGQTIKDIAAFRYVIDGGRKECEQLTYALIGAMGALGYKLDKNEVDNYLRDLKLPFGHNYGPKKNGYESIHLLFVGDDGKYVEAQIRTKEMHVTAELGRAAHDRYKSEKLAKWISEDDISLDSLPKHILSSSFGRFNGQLYRVTSDSVSPPTLLDLLFAAGPKHGLCAPKTVEVKRLLANGQLTKLKLHVASPLQDGDEVVPPLTTSLSLSSFHRESVNSPFAKTIIALMEREKLDIKELDTRTHKAQVAGKKILDQLLLREKNSLNELMESALGKDSLHYWTKTTYSSLQPVFSLFNINTKGVSGNNAEALEMLLALSDKKENLPKKIGEIIRTTSTAVAYRIRDDQAEIKVVAANIPSIFRFITNELKEGNLEVTQLDCKPLNSSFSLINIKIKIAPADNTKAAREQARENCENEIAALLAKAGGIYNDVKTPNQEEPTKYTISFSYTSLKVSLLHDLIYKLTKADGLITEAFIPNMTKTVTSPDEQIAKLSLSDKNANPKVAAKLAKQMSSPEKRTDAFIKGTLPFKYALKIKKEALKLLGATTTLE